ncbi:hypothetical protein KAU45_07565 [bacterium]|nr:hypothetical protein [bacterium]
MSSFNDIPVIKDGKVVAQATGMGTRVVFRCANENCFTQLLFKATGEESQEERCHSCGTVYRLIFSPDDGRVVGLEMR